MMPCGHWLSHRRCITISNRLRLPVIAARRCTGTIILGDGSQWLYDFKRGVLVGPHPEPRNYSLSAPEKTE